MRLKYKVGFLAMIAVVDVMVIVIVVMGHGSFTVKNDVSTKNSAHIVESNSDTKKTAIELSKSTEQVISSQEKLIIDIPDELVEPEQQEDVENYVIEDNAISSSQIELSESADNQKTEEVVLELSNVSYDDMSIEEKETALYAGTLPLEYSGLYTYSNDRLTASKGALYFNGHKETYYSEKVLPGNGLNIPGRHVADDGTIRDGDGYICVAADWEYMAKGSILITSLGPAKVYDTGCTYGIIDIYVNW